mmetsp:Transcript_58215/g.149892  ORF Transcript_58215/g.149892 Transcript_58215/m.149892 type:complete len:622 (-) Transcript_58215:97-1962(-)
MCRTTYELDADFCASMAWCFQRAAVGNLRDAQMGACLLKSGCPGVHPQAGPNGPRGNEEGTLVRSVAAELSPAVPSACSSLDERRPPPEGLTARQHQVDHIDNDQEVAGGLRKRAQRRRQHKEHHEDQRAHHPIDALRDTRHVLRNRLAADLDAVDHPREGHGQEHVLHVGAQRIRDSGRGLVLLRHQYRGHRVGEGGSDRADRDAQEGVGQGWDVVMDLVRDLEHTPGEDGQPEHRPREAQRPPPLLARVLHVHREHGRFEEEVDAEFRDRGELHGRAAILHSVDQVLPGTHYGGVIAMDPRPAQGVLLDHFEQLNALIRIPNRDPERDVLEPMVEFELKHTHVHDHHLLQVLVLQDLAQHGVRVVELEADGLAPVAAFDAAAALGLLRIGVDAVRRDIQVEGRRLACIVSIHHAAVDDLLDLHVDAVHPSLRLAARRRVVLAALLRPQERNGIDEVRREVDAGDVAPSRGEEDVGLVRLDGIVPQRPAQQDNRDGVCDHIPGERHARNLQWQDRCGEEGAADDDEDVEDFGAHNDADTSIGSRVQSDQVGEELRAVAAQRADRRARDRLLAPPVHPFLRALAHLLDEDVDGRHKVRIADVVLREEHEPDADEPHAADVD